MFSGKGGIYTKGGDSAVPTAPAHCDDAGIICLGDIAIGDCQSKTVKSPMV